MLAQSPRKIERCAELGRYWPSGGEPAFPRTSNLRRRSLRCKFGDVEPNFFIPALREPDDSVSSVDVYLSVSRRSKHVLDFRKHQDLLMRVGPDRSRPANQRHFAQVLHLARAPGRGVLAKCLNHYKPETDGGNGETLLLL